jgi:hypothetical protein
MLCEGEDPALVLSVRNQGPRIDAAGSVCITYSLGVRHVVTFESRHVELQLLR